MREIAHMIEKHIQQDPGGRGLEQWAVQGELLPAVEKMVKSDNILLATGFYILSAGEIETDGPPGAIVLAEALRKAGKKVTLIYDDHSNAIMKNGLSSINGKVDTLALSVDHNFDSDPLKVGENSCFIALERPGKALDGKYYNFRGKDISSYHASLDEFYTECKNNGITTIGIGDGGNELGMGRVSSAVDDFVPFDRPFSCQTESDFCVCAGVSNWAGYGMAALLSSMLNRNLMPEPYELRDLLDAIVDAGAVDGVSGKAEPTVDGLEASWEHDIFSAMYQIASDSEKNG